MVSPGPRFFFFSLLETVLCNPAGLELAILLTSGITGVHLHARLQILIGYLIEALY
jgi:hypothetical protein